jgi:hypothetical protein
MTLQHYSVASSEQDQPLGGLNFQHETCFSMQSTGLHDLEDGSVLWIRAS